MQETDKIVYAGFFVRLCAAFLDGILLFFLLLTVRIPMWVTMLTQGGNPFSYHVLFEFSIWDVLIYLLGTSYYVLMLYFSGATIGKKLLRIKVIAGEDREKISFFTALYREVIGKYISGAILCLGFLLIGVDEKKRGLHDMFCDTYVIYDFERSKNKKNMEYTYMKDAIVTEESAIMEEDTTKMQEDIEQ